MDDRLITVTVLAVLLVVALGVIAFFVVLYRNAKRGSSSERQRREEAERRETAMSLRLDAFHEHVGKIRQGTAEKPPHRLWRAKGFGWLAGLVTGASFAARTTPGTGGAAVLSMKAAACGAAALLATGGIAYTVLDKPDLDGGEHPLSSAVVAAPPTMRAKAAAPVPVVATTRPTETETTTPATKSTPTPSATSTSATTLSPTTTPTKSPPPTTQSRDASASHTTTASSPDQAPQASVTVRGTPGTTPASTDAAPRAAPAPAAAPVDDTKVVRPVPDTPATSAAPTSNVRPASRTCLDLNPAAPVLVCIG